MPSPQEGAYLDRPHVLYILGLIIFYYLYLSVGAIRLVRPVGNIDLIGRTLM